METAKVVGVTPVNASGSDLQDTLQETAEAINGVMDSFPDDVPEEEGEKAKGFLNNFMDYIKSSAFHDDVMETSRQYKIPPKRVANGFFSSCLATVGDILGIAISTVGNAGHTLIDILASLAHGAVNVIVKVAQGLASIVTLNKTNVCASA